MPNFIKISLNGCRDIAFNVFQNGGCPRRCCNIAIYKDGSHPPFSIVGQIWGLRTTKIWWSITVQNLVRIALIVLIIQKFEYFVHLA